MVVKSAIILLAAIVLVNAESPPEYQISSGYQVGRPPYRVRQSGASKIFGWLGSRFAKIPYFLPRVPSFPKYTPHQHLQQLPQYQSVILPDPQQSTPEPQLQAVGDYQNPGHANAIEQYNNIETENNPPPPVYESPSPNEIPVDNKVPNFKDHFEVVPSHLLSYQKEVMPPVEGGWQPGFGGIPFPTSPIPSAPVQNNQQGSNQIPVVPQSMGPDYFNTAYGHENKESQQQQNQQQTQHSEQQTFQTPHYNIQTPVQPSSNHQSNQQTYVQPNNNFGATFGDIQQQPAQYLGSSSSPIGQQVRQPNQQNGYSSASFDLNHADFSSLLSSIGSSGQDIVGSDGFNVQGSHIVPVSAKPPKKAQGSQPGQKADGYVASGIPGVQILSQTDDGGNPVFEVLADADAPSFGGHPFDINKLIALIEPGAELVDTPQLSESSSETKSVYESAPAQATSGTSDLLLSESDPEPSLTSVEGSKIKKPFSYFFSTNKNDSDKNKSSLKEIMEFFQQTGGKGYVVVEKKRSPDDALTPDDDLTDLTDGFSRLNITSETLPLLDIDKENGNLLKYSIIPHGYTVESTKSKVTTPSPGPNSSKSYSFKPLGPRKSFLNKLTRPTVKFENLTSPTVFFAVRATTQHPNHNYNSSSTSVRRDELPPVIPTVNTLLDAIHSPTLDSDLISSVTQTPDDTDDLSFAESQVKSIAITVTPPPHLTSSSTTSTSTSVPPLIPVTKKSVSSSSSSKKRPAPVYRRKTSKINNQTII